MGNSIEGFIVNEPITVLPFPSSEFLKTSLRVQMQQPMGTVSYLEMVNESSADGDGEDGMGRIGLQVRYQHIEAQTYQVQSEHSKEQASDLDRFNIDIVTQISSMLNNESLNNMEKILYKKYYDLGLETHIKSINKWRRFLSKYFKLSFPIYTESDKICSKILILSNMVAIRTRRGSANFVVVSPMIASLIADDPKSELLIESIQHNDGLYPFAIISDRVKVFIDPKMTYDNSTIVLGKTTEEGNTGVVMGEYSRQLFKNDTYDSVNLIPTIKFQLIDRFVIADIGNDSNNGFVTANISIGKKPLWRKLIRA
jgi:hypothetical protein